MNGPELPAVAGPGNSGLPDLRPAARFWLDRGRAAPGPLDLGRVMALFRDWIAVLGLGAWRLDFEIDPGGELREGVAMEVRRSDYHDRAVVTIAPWAVGEGDASATAPGIVDTTVSPDFIEGVIVHELLHLALRDLVFTVHEWFAGRLPEGEFEMLGRVLHRAEEQTIDRLAAALVRSLGSTRERDAS